MRIIKIVRRKVIRPKKRRYLDPSSDLILPTQTTQGVLKRRLLKTVIRLAKLKSDDSKLEINEFNKNAFQEFDLNNKAKKFRRVTIVKRIRKIKKNKKNSIFSDPTAKKKKFINELDNSISAVNNFENDLNNSYEQSEIKSQPDKRFSGVIIQQKEQNEKEIIKAANDLIDKKYLSGLFF